MWDQWLSVRKKIYNNIDMINLIFENIFSEDRTKINTITSMLIAQWVNSRGRIHLSSLLKEVEYRTQVAVEL